LKNDKGLFAYFIKYVELSHNWRYKQILEVNACSAPLVVVITVNLQCQHMNMWRQIWCTEFAWHWKKCGVLQTIVTVASSTYSTICYNKSQIMWFECQWWFTITWL